MRLTNWEYVFSATSRELAVTAVPCMSLGKTMRFPVFRVVSRYVPDGIDMMARWTGYEVKTGPYSRSDTEQITIRGHYIYGLSQAIDVRYRSMMRQRFRSDTLAHRSSRSRGPITIHEAGIGAHTIADVQKISVAPLAHEQYEVGTCLSLSINLGEKAP